MHHNKYITEHNTQADTFQKKKEEEAQFWPASISLPGEPAANSYCTYHKEESISVSMANQIPNIKRA